MNLLPVYCYVNPSLSISTQSGHIHAQSTNSRVLLQQLKTLKIKPPASFTHTAGLSRKNSQRGFVPPLATI